MLVDLDKVKQIIYKLYDNNNSFVDNYVIPELNKLAYGKLCQCLNCNKDIYFDRECNVYRHVDNMFIACDGDVGYYELNTKIAIPKPDNNHSCETQCKVNSK